MKFKNLLGFRSKHADAWDHPDAVYLASVVVSEYGAALEETALFTLGVSEKRLPRPKKEIEAALELLLKFLHNKGSWGKLKRKYPQIAAEITTDRYYDALKKGYVELAKFLPGDEAEPCERASRLLKKQHDLKTIGGVIDELKLPWFEEVLRINKRISEDSSFRLKRLQDNFETKKIPF